RAVREPGLRPVAARLYERYRRWMEALIRAGVESGEFRSDADVAATANLAMALLDGVGVRALIDDPAMDVESAPSDRSHPQAAASGCRGRGDRRARIRLDPGGRRRRTGRDQPAGRDLLVRVQGRTAHQRAHLR